MAIEIVTGDDKSLPLVLSVDGVVEPINQVAVIKVAIIDEGHTQKWLNEVTVDTSAAGSDLDNGLIVVAWTEAETGAISSLGRALLEIQVDDGGKDTYFAEVTIINGLIA